MTNPADLLRLNKERLVKGMKRTRLSAKKLRNTTTFYALDNLKILEG